MDTDKTKMYKRTMFLWDSVQGNSNRRLFVKVWLICFLVIGTYVNLSLTNNDINDFSSLNNYEIIQQIALSGHC